MTIRPMQRGEAETCEQILRSLPDWFGIEEALVQYVRDLAGLEAMVAAAETSLRERSFSFLQVKTLGPSRPDGPYERTRHFPQKTPTPSRG